MNNPVLPLLDGLLGLSQTFSDNASQKNWAEIEDLEKEQGAPSANARQQLSAGTSLSTSADPKDVLLRISALSGERAEPGGVSNHDGQGDEIADTAMWSDAAMEVERGENPKADFVETFSRSLTVGGEKVSPSSPMQTTAVADWQGTSDISLPPTPADGQSEQAITAAADSVEYGLATSGPVVAAQKLHSAVRSFSPAQVSALLDNLAPVVAKLVEQAVRGDDGGGAAVVEEKPRDVRTALVLAHVAAALDKDPRNPSAIRLLRDIGPVILGSTNPNDNTTFSGLARTIGVGAGVRLVLAVAADLAHRDDNPSRARALVLLMLSAFGALGERIDGAYSDVLQQAGPLCLEWLSWRDMGEEKAIERLINSLMTQPDLLEDMAPGLERLEQTGLEAFRAVRDLSAFTIDPNLGDVHAHFLQSESVFASIAGSRAALRDIRHTTVARSASGDDVTLDMIRLTLTDIGFEAPKAAFLAELSALENNVLMLGANWTALESFARMEVQGRAFQRLLAFLNGQFVMAARPDVIGFEDDDMQG